MLGSKLKILGLSTLALAAMAISAASAQAEKGAFWTVNEQGWSALSPTLTGSLENNFGKLLGKIGANALHISCTGGLPEGARLVEPNGSLEGKVKFTGCKLFTLVKGGAGEELKACEPHEGAEKGVIFTKEGKGLITLHEGGGVVTLEPKEGTTFATINTSETCSFGEKIIVGGKLVLKDCEGKFSTDLVTHLVEELPALTELFLNGNKANKATLDGSALIKLSGTHAGLTFAGHPA